MEKGHYSVLRVSNLSQIGNFSIERQKESIEAYATLHKISGCSESTLRFYEYVIGKLIHYLISTYSLPNRENH